MSMDKVHTIGGTYPNVTATPADRPEGKRPVKLTEKAAQKLVQDLTSSEGKARQRVRKKLDAIHELREHIPGPTVTLPEREKVRAAMEEVARAQKAHSETIEALQAAEIPQDEREFLFENSEKERSKHNDHYKDLKTWAEQLWVPSRRGNDGNPPSQTADPSSQTFVDLSTDPLGATNKAVTVPSLSRRSKAGSRAGSVASSIASSASMRRRLEAQVELDALKVRKERDERRKREDAELRRRKFEEEKEDLMRKQRAAEEESRLKELEERRKQEDEELRLRTEMQKAIVVEQAELNREHDLGSDDPGDEDENRTPGQLQSDEPSLRPTAREFIPGPPDQVSVPSSRPFNPPPVFEQHVPESSQRTVSFDRSAGPYCLQTAPACPPPNQEPPTWLTAGPATGTNPWPTRPAVATASDQMTQPTYWDIMYLGPPKLTKFDGEAEKWLPFVHTFEMNIASRTNDPALKMAKLLEYVTDGVRADIAGFELDRTNGYSRSMQLLWDFYGHPSRIVNKISQGLVSGNVIRANDRLGLRRLANQLGMAIDSVLAVEKRYSDHVRDNDYLRTLDHPENLRKILRRIPPFIRNEFVDKLGLRPGSLVELRDFLDRKTVAAAHPLAIDLERSEPERQQQEPRRPQKKVFATDKDTRPEDNAKRENTVKKENYSKKGNPGCVCCDEVHELKECEKFKKMDPYKRKEVLRKRKLCYNCFLQHMCNDCRKPSMCEESSCKWDSKHSPLLHIKKREAARTDEGNDPPPATKEKDSEKEKQLFNTIHSNNGVFLGVCAVRLSNPETGKTITCYALADGSSNSDVISQEAVDILGLHTKRSGIKIPYYTITGRTELESITTDVKIQSFEDVSVGEVLEDVEVLDCEHFSRNRVPERFDVHEWDHIGDMPTVDQVEFPRVLMLVGIPHTDFHRPQGCSYLEGIAGAPYVNHTKFGHVLYGGAVNRKEPINVNFIDAGNTDKLFDQWLNMEDVTNLYDPKKLPSLEERRAAEIVDAGIKFHEEKGQYVVPVPWRETDPTMPNNHTQAEKCLEGMRKRFQKDPKYFAEYNAAIQKYLDNGHAELIPDTELQGKPGKVHYLLHHNVRHPRKQDVRIVYNPSKKINGTSLNDKIIPCPNRLEDLVALIVRFRQSPIAVSADVKSFFHAVLVPDDTKDFMRYLWFDQGKIDGLVRQLRLLVHLFGGVASQYCSISALIHCLRTRSPEEWTPEFIEKMVRSFYSDDHLRSFETKEEAVNVLTQLVQTLKEGGFTLAKFVSNEAEVVCTLNPELQSQPKVAIEDKSGQESSALGIDWDPKSDTLSYRYCERPSKGPEYSKREVLSTLMRFFDPLGHMVPFTLPMKVLMQKLVIAEYGWDTQLDEVFAREFDKCCENLKRASTIQISRCYVSKEFGSVTDRQLHLFADGSAVGYGCCAYLRSTNEEGAIACSLVMGKGRICPTSRTMTTPQTEMCGALMASRMARYLLHELEVKIDDLFYWVDSMATLRYIRNRTQRYKIFMGNRIREIQEETEVKQWRYVPTNLNPSDLCSRPTFLPDGDAMADQRVRFWLHGPEYLLRDPDEWPAEVEVGPLDPTDPELRKEVVVQATVREQEDVAGRVRSSLMELIIRSPNMFTMKRKFAWLRVFVIYLRSKSNRNDGTAASIGPPSVQDLEAAESAIVRLVQQTEFKEELSVLSKGRLVPKTSPLAKLSPFIEEKSGLIRVGTRLLRTDAPYEFRYPVILPKKNHVTHLLTHAAHLKVCHQGPNAVLTELRNRYWVIAAKPEVNRVIKKCIPCRRYNQRLGQQIMASLPEDRLSRDKPVFHATSVDLFGHFLVKRGRSQVKRWVALFTCMASRAVHLEIVHSLDMDSFIQALRRFIARRGSISILQSDNATNFRGSSREIAEALESWNNSGIERRLQQQGITWKFLPSRASHMGGCHERLIRSARACLRHTIEEQTLCDETLCTLVAECENVLNNRPLTEFSNDPNDLAPLRPNDILQSASASSLPPGNFPEEGYLKRRWRQTQQLVNRFWSRFYREYLSHLSLRTKWLRTRRDFQVNDLVLIAEPSVHRSQWELGRIIEVYPGEDGHVRSCKIKTKVSERVRPVAKLCLLECAASEN